MINREVKKITPHSFEIEKTGSIFSGTSEMYRWRFEIDSSIFTVDFDVSFITGKKILSINGIQQTIISK